MNYRSHSRTEIIEAQKKKSGLAIFALDTAGAGEDDMLIADSPADRQEVLSEVFEYYEIDQLPEGWSLDLVDWDVDAA